jgi:hypothetical protein
MQSFSVLSVVAAAALFVAPVQAAELRLHPKAVLELFTSQGCSSCPTADLKFGDLSRQTDLITLAYHVDYWDYIGWTDTFGRKENSELQRAYAQSWKSSRIYTPQLIVNGRKGVVGSRDQDVTEALGGATLALPVEISVGDRMLDVTVGPGAAGADAMVWLVTFKDHAQVQIERGENAGRTMDYRQIVTGRQMLGMWDPATGTHLKLPLSELKADGSNGAAILVQTDKDGLPGPILGAASFRL